MRTDAPDGAHPGSAGFFAALADLVRHGEIVVDRPRGRPHPRIPDVVYPLDYGYLAGTTGGDGEGIDVFVGSAAGAGVAGVLLTADLAKRDAEIKVLVDCSPEEVGMARDFVSGVLGIGGHLVRPGEA
ncbi:inorganic pyrophosphatase [Saccharopolyspora sp. NPDC050642]|uniref:inorganic pyrophosphatase n=1 Tax=Saccharopolyspora sp. NPDC050642 TaxID=3157099 RepID=UPI0034044993